MQQCCSALPSHSPNVSFILISPSPDMTNFTRMLTGNVIVNVFKSDAVIWWAAIFRTPHPRCSTICCICQQSQGSAMTRLRSHDLREAISDLLTVTMYLQDSLSILHGPGLHKKDLRHCEALRNLSQCTWISTLLEVSSCPPSDQT